MTVSFLCGTDDDGSVSHRRHKTTAGNSHNSHKSPSLGDAVSYNSTQWCVLWTGMGWWMLWGDEVGGLEVFRGMASCNDGVDAVKGWGGWTWGISGHGKLLRWGGWCEEVRWMDWIYFGAWQAVNMDSCGYVDKITWGDIRSGRRGNEGTHHTSTVPWVTSPTVVFTSLCCIVLSLTHTHPHTHVQQHRLSISSCAFSSSNTCTVNTTQHTNKHDELLVLFSFSFVIYSPMKPWRTGYALTRGITSSSSFFSVLFSAKHYNKKR